eukprot:m.16984 g.16984  ORF g.16984 m.16984 type:complete len:168 (+) comp5366_c0_seq1:124-627(+)
MSKRAQTLQQQTRMHQVVITVLVQVCRVSVRGTARLLVGCQIPIHPIINIPCRKFATGAADATATIWDIDELICVRTITTCEWPIRTVGFSHDGKLLATGSDDPFIFIHSVDTGEKIHQISAESGAFTLAWHPSQMVLAYAGDEKDREHRAAGLISLFGVPSSGDHA